MFKIMYETVRQNLPIDVSAFIGDTQAFLQDANIIALKEGLAVSLDANGNVALAGASGVVAGWLVQDASGLFHENPAALAAGRVAVTNGPVIAVTDQVASGLLTAAIGSAVSVGSDAKLTNGSGVAVGYLQATNATLPEEVPVGCVKVVLTSPAA